MRYRIFLLSVILFSCYIQNKVLAQSYTVYGKITDAETGEPIPFANVFFEGTTIGVSTDFDGLYTLTFNQPQDSLSASYLGYNGRSKPLQNKTKQKIDFQLFPSSQVLKAVDIVYGQYENPAWEILRKVVKNRSKNNPQKQKGYEYESYTKTEVDIDNITEKFREKKVVNKILSLLDSIEKIKGDDGKPIIPVFVSEVLSKRHYRRGPQRKKEEIIKRKITGTGLTKIFPFIKDLLGSSFIEINFYDSWTNLISKDFVSPIADSWRVFYDYELQIKQDTIKGVLCDRINFTPKRPEDLAFFGTMWITVGSAALKQIEVTTTENINLNFIDKIKIQQSFTPILQNQDTVWMPEKSRMVIDIGEVKDSWAGLLVKTYISNQNFVTNTKRPLAFFNESVQVSENVNEDSFEFWEKARLEPLTKSEQNIFRMIDTIKNIPTVKTYVNVLDIIINGYWQREKIDIGPYLYSYAYNNIEGHRPRLGLRTNARWHPRWLLQGYIAYGTKDKEFKYNAEINYIFSPKRWGVIGIQSNEDLDLLAIDRTDYGTQNLTNYFTNPTLFMVASRFGSLLGFGDLLRPYRHTIRRAWIGYDILPSVNQKFLFQNRTVIPLFDFGYYQQGKEQTAANLKDRFTVTEFVGETTIFIGATIGSYGNRRTLLGSKKPIVRFRYTLGLSGVLGGEIAYQKMEGSFEHNVRLGSLGRTRYKISVGYVPSLVPYPLLINHLGNNKPIYNKNAFNMMRSFEFVSDRFISLQLFHRFEGVFLNRIPLLRKISARAIATANIMYGSIRSKNLQSNLNATSAITGMNSVRPFSFIEKEPYVEVGYGVENLFKFIRVDFLHRINYLENKNENANLLDSRSTISRFSVKVLAQLNF